MAELPVKIPRLNVTLIAKDVDVSIVEAFQQMGYEKPSPMQERTVCAFVGGNDTFVILPTGRGKSLCFLTLPLVFDRLRRRAGYPTVAPQFYSLLVL